MMIQIHQLCCIFLSMNYVKIKFYSHPFSNVRLRCFCELSLEAPRDSVICLCEKHTSEACVRAQFSPCGICGGERGTGTGLSSSLSAFPVSIVLQLLRIHSDAIWGLDSGPVSGRSSAYT